jgi:hypothetical protein
MKKAPRRALFWCDDADDAPDRCLFVSLRQPSTAVPTML